jgi:hypothetical protein
MYSCLICNILLERGDKECILILVLFRKRKLAKKDSLDAFLDDLAKDQPPLR